MVLLDADVAEGRGHLRVGYHAARINRNKAGDLDAIVHDGFEALLDPADDQLKILVEAEV